MQHGIICDIPKNYTVKRKLYAFFTNIAKMSNKLVINICGVKYKCPFQVRPKLHIFKSKTKKYRTPPRTPLFSFSGYAPLCLVDSLLKMAPLKKIKNKNTLGVRRKKRGTIKFQGFGLFKQFCFSLHSIEHPFLSE